MCYSIANSIAILEAFLGKVWGLRMRAQKLDRNYKKCYATNSGKRSAPPVLVLGKRSIDISTMKRKISYEN